MKYKLALFVARISLESVRPKNQMLKRRRESSCIRWENSKHVRCSLWFNVFVLMSFVVLHTITIVANHPDFGGIITIFDCRFRLTPNSPEIPIFYYFPHWWYWKNGWRRSPHKMDHKIPKLYSIKNEINGCFHGGNIGYNIGDAVHNTVRSFKDAKWAGVQEESGRAFSITGTILYPTRKTTTLSPNLSRKELTTQIIVTRIDNIREVIRWKNDWEYLRR